MWQNIIISFYGTLIVTKIPQKSKTLFSAKQKFSCKEMISRSFVAIFLVLREKLVVEPSLEIGEKIKTSTVAKLKNKFALMQLSLTKSWLAKNSNKNLSSSWNFKLTFFNEVASFGNDVHPASMVSNFFLVSVIFWRHFIKSVRKLDTVKLKWGTNSENPGNEVYIHLKLRPDFYLKTL